MSSVTASNRQSLDEVPGNRRPRPEFVHMRLPYGEAAEFLKYEIIHWFEVHKPKPEPEPVRPSSQFKIPWYIPHIKDARISSIIAYHIDLINEDFKHNPYGIGARWFWVVMVAAFMFWGGHIAAGTAESAVDAYGATYSTAIKQGLLPLSRGFLNGIPVVWMIVAFCFPALIANLQEQLGALGYHDVKL